MTKYLVSGGAGFIGSHITEALVKRGDRVRVLDDLSTGLEENLALVRDKIEFQRGDLRNPEDVAKATIGIDCIFHEGALRSVPRSVEDPSSTNTVNVTGTLQLLLAARAAKVKRVVYASSSSVYGDIKKYPQTESMRGSPLSPYAVAKYAGELYCTMFAKTLGLETVSLRYFNVFGPRQHPDSPYAAVIPKLMKWAAEGTPLEIHWDGRQSRDFTYIENVVDANLLAAAVPGISGEVFNIACGKTNSLLQIIRELETFIGHPLKRHHSPQRPGDVRKTWADIHHARRKLRYVPRVDLHEGLRRTWQWFTAQQTKATVPL